MHMAYSALQIPVQGRQNPSRINVDVTDHVDVLSLQSSSGSKKNKNYQWFHDQEILIKQRNLDDDYERLCWAYRHFKTFDYYASDALLNNDRLRSSQSTSTSFCDSPLLSADIHPRYGPMGLCRFENSKFRGIINCSGNKSDTKNNDRMVSCNERGSEEDRKRKERVFWDYVFLLHKTCEDNSLVETVLSESELFIDAAFCKQGASLIIKLIKKLKDEKSDHAFTLTRILSTRFLDMTTHPIARTVIQNCFFFFGSRPNKIFYEKAIRNFKVLATHEVGCRSLNDCINTISGKQRVWLLNQIADVSDYLSDHPYGIYVVQNVLALKDRQVNVKILKCLRGQFIHLAQKKEGSRVIEKCIESCNLGVIYVVKEILHNPGAPFLLAQHQFGNYVIQKALEKAMKPSFTPIYFALVRSLEPHREELNQIKGGRNLIRLLEKAYSV